MTHSKLTFITTTLATLRAAFDGASSRHDHCFCRWNIADDDNRDRLSGQSSMDWRADNIIATKTLILRERSIGLAANNNSTQSQAAVIQEPGVISTMHFRGDHSAFRQFESLAHDAAYCLVKLAILSPLTLRLPELVPLSAITGVFSKSADTQLPSGLIERWIAFLHVTAWQQIAVSPLRAKRQIWNNNVSVSGNPEEMQDLIADFKLGGLKELQFPPRFFTSTLLSSINLCSVYAIDLLLAGPLSARRIDFEQFSATLQTLKPGKKHATQYHRLIRDILSVLFEPDLHSPVCEEVIHEGRGRIDIVCSNAAESGYFYDLPFRHDLFCPVIFFECKNYSSDIGSEEVSQLTSRFSDRRGQVGFIVCRKVSDKTLARKRCRDALLDNKGHVLVLDDDDLCALLQYKSRNDRTAITKYLHAMFRPVFMDA